MTISMHSASVPVYVKMLTSLITWLERAEAHATARKFDANQWLAMRLTPDMLPLSAQIQIATDQAKGAAARLGGVDIPKYEDTETTIEELKARVRKTIDFVQSIPAAQIDGTEDKDITLPTRTGSRQLKGEAYLLHFSLPNFYFHVTMTYALLRQHGVDIGKMDFLGAR